MEALHRAAGQLIVGGFPGPEVDPTFADLAREGLLGGAILFKRNIVDLEQTATLVRALRTLPAPAPLSVSVDQEGGRVARLGPPFPALPPMRVFGELRRKSLAHQAGSLLGRSLRTLGFHQDYAPVLDVDTNPANPVIGDRSFGAEPALVARLGAALIDGLQSEGVAACGKHFPGHGDTHLDSHLALPRLDHDRARLEAVELLPFYAAARVDCASIMTAHVLFTALDPDHPATLSEKIIEPVLRRQIGFLGVIVSDDLEMRAIADHYGVEDAAVRAIRAGCDQLLVCSKVEWVPRVHAALVAAVEDGTLPRARLFEAAERIAAFKARWVTRAPLPDPLMLAFPRDAHAELLAELDAGPVRKSAPRTLEIDLGEDPEVLALLEDD